MEGQGRGGRLRSGRLGAQHLIKQPKVLVEPRAQEPSSWRMPASTAPGLAYGESTAEPTVLARVIPISPGARKIRETINGSWPASGAFVEPGRAGLAQSRHHGCRQAAQAGEGVLPQERR
jgi:hypothetical protein